MNGMNTHRSAAHAGYALITALILLAALTLVAVTAIKGVGLELRMSGNNSQATEAFESSEAPRAMLSRLLDVHTYNRGWPATIGGTVLDGDFDYPIPPGISILDKDADTAPDDWFVSNNETYIPDSLTTDSRFSLDVAAAGQTTPFTVASDLAVFKLRTDISPGAGSAMVAGYEGAGKAAAAGGGAVYFLVRSRATDTAGEAVGVTASDYRHVIRN